ncbi:transglycosylase domain-containing protein [Actinocatenispora rupis]|uniref:transglycosylase domain-containing protein n=1 Tax=Actinocatenispora rupis TaxID=519421 RepID=UPI0031E4F4C1
MRPASPVGDGASDFFSDSYEDVERRERAERRRTSGTPRARKRRRRRRIVASIAILLLLAGIGTIGGAYYFTSVPLPSEIRAQVPSTFYYSDGKTQLAKLGASNGSHVDVSKLPKYVKYAVVSAEDRSFYKNSGVDFKGILRAAWGHVTGNDDAGGASTITMQYAKLMADRMQTNRTYTEKLKETVIAMKLDQKYDKDTILGFYLDLVYFNRGATGIQAAARAYFGKDATKLTPEEAAVLAAVIKDPTHFDPQSDRKAAQGRWEYVLAGMKKLGVYDKPISLSNYPTVKPDDPNSHGATSGLDKPTGFVVSQVIDELTDHKVLSQEPDYDQRRDRTKQALETGGYRIVTTIDKTVQDDAVEAAHYGIREARPTNKKIAAALVAVEPGTGNVLAYYGGDNGTGYDMAGNPHQPGSSFKVYTLAAGVQDGYSVKSYWNGDETEPFDDRGADGKVHNSDGEHCHDAGYTDGHEVCTLYEATAESLNTVFYALAKKVGKAKVLELARNAGITSITSDGHTGRATKYDLTGVDTEQAAQEVVDKGAFGNEIGFGQYPVTPLDHANGYATFANNGVYTEQHFVTRLVNADGTTRYVPRKVQRTVFSRTVAADIDWVLRKVATDDHQMIHPYRQQANKTGTWEFPNKENRNENAHAWMCGYVPQLASTVWMGRKDQDGPIWNQRMQPLYGSEFPSDIWSRFMSNALRDLKKTPQDFPTPTFAGTLTGQYGAPSPPAQPTTGTPPSPTPAQTTPSPSYSVPGPPGDTGTPDPGQSSCNATDPACNRRNDNPAAPG